MVIMMTSAERGMILKVVRIRTGYGRKDGSLIYEEVIGEDYFDENREQLVLEMWLKGYISSKDSDKFAKQS